MGPTAGRIGPNAITQIQCALEQSVGAEATRALFGRAGLARYLTAPPVHMVAEGEVIALHRVLREQLAMLPALAIARRAGQATGAYLIEHRIPAAARLLLEALPRALSGRLLRAAILRHGWTFAGSAALRASAGARISFTLENCPICRGARAPRPLCAYYAATFEYLFQRLIDRRATVLETDCAAVAGRLCRFEVRGAGG